MFSKIQFWRGILDPKHYLSDEKVTDAFAKLFAGSTGSNLEQLNGVNKDYPIYSIRLDSEHRILFTVYKANICILDVVDHGRAYEQSRFLTKPKSVESFLLKHNIEASFAQAANADENGANAAVASSEDAEFLKKLRASLGIADETEPEFSIEEAKKIDYCHGQFISLSTEQDKVIETTLPAIIQGPAGSGKTSTVFCLLVDYYKKYKDIPEYFPIVYITKNKELATKLKDEWRQLMGQDASEKVLFKMYEEIIKEEYQESIFWQFFDFEVWLKQISASKTLTVDLSPNTIWQEMRIRSGYTHEEYLELGKKQSSISEDKRARIETIYETFLAVAQENGAIVPELQKLELANKKAMVIVDEAQDLSFGELATLESLAENRKIAYLLGDHQILYDGKSRLEYLKSLLNNKGKNKISFIKLQGTFRCHKFISDLANFFIAAKYYLTGGSADSEESVHLESFGAEGGVKFLTDEKEYGDLVKKITENDSIEIAVITDNKFIPQRKETESDVDYNKILKKIFGTVLVFTPESVKGLEFKEVILYRLLDWNLESITEFNKKYTADPDEKKFKFKTTAERQVAEEVAIHRPKIPVNEEHLGKLNRMITALTRASEEVVIYHSLRETKRANPFFDLLKEVSGKLRGNTDDEKQKKPSTKEEWLIRAETYYKSNELDLKTKALAILADKLTTIEAQELTIKWEREIKEKDEVARKKGKAMQPVYYCDEEDERTHPASQQASTAEPISKPQQASKNQDEPSTQKQEQINSIVNGKDKGKKGKKKRTTQTAKTNTPVKKTTTSAKNAASAELGKKLASASNKPADINDNMPSFVATAFNNTKNTFSKNNFPKFIKELIKTKFLLKFISTMYNIDLVSHAFMDALFEQMLLPVPPRNQNHISTDELKSILSTSPSDDQYGLIINKIIQFKKMKEFLELVGKDKTLLDFLAQQLPLKFQQIPLLHIIIDLCPDNVEKLLELADADKNIMDVIIKTLPETIPANDSNNTNTNINGLHLLCNKENYPNQNIEKLLELAKKYPDLLTVITPLLAKENDHHITSLQCIVENATLKFSTLLDLAKTNENLLTVIIEDLPKQDTDQDTLLHRIAYRAAPVVYKLMNLAKKYLEAGNEKLLYAIIEALPKKNSFEWTTLHALADMAPFSFLTLFELSKNHSKLRKIIIDVLPKQNNNDYTFLHSLVERAPEIVEKLIALVKDDPDLGQAVTEVLPKETKYKATILHLIADYTPHSFLPLLEEAKTNPKLLKSIIEVLPKQNQINYTILHYLGVKAPIVFDKLMDLANSNPDLLKAVIEALPKQNVNHCNVLVTILSNKDICLTKVLELVRQYDEFGNTVFLLLLDVELPYILELITNFPVIKTQFITFLKNSPSEKSLTILNAIQPKPQLSDSNAISTVEIQYTTNADSANKKSPLQETSFFGAGSTDASEGQSSSEIPSNAKQTLSSN